MDPIVGQIQLFTFPYETVGWFLCAGQELPVSQFNILYAVIGNTFGGTGPATLKLPDLQGKEPAPGMKYYICFQGSFPQRV